MSTFFPRSSAIDSAVSTSSSASLVLAQRLASLLFFSSGEKASEEEDLGRSFLFGGIELQRITRQKAEHRSIRPYTSTIPSILATWQRQSFLHFKLASMRFQKSAFHWLLTNVKKFCKIHAVWRKLNKHESLYFCSQFERAKATCWKNSKRLIPLKNEKENKIGERAVFQWLIDLLWHAFF